MTTYQNKPQNTNLSWQPIQKPAEIAENRLINAILNGTFPINSNLPGERELSESLGVTRPTLRETLQRLERDGWVEIHQGKPTRVRDYWIEGKLGVLNALCGHTDHIPENFVTNLLNVRLAMAPMYTAQAVSLAPMKVVTLLEGREGLKDSPEKCAQFDWVLQHELTILSGNPVFVMILNGFRDLYLKLAPLYFAIPTARLHSLTYYQELAIAAAENNIFLARRLTEDIMRNSLSFWQQTKLYQAK